MKKKILFGFNYLGINGEQFAFFPEHYRPGQEQKLNFKVNFGTDPSKRAMACEIIADFSSNDDQLFLRCAASCSFSIDESYWEDKIDVDKANVDLDPIVYSHFAAFTVGTLRGILHVRSVNARVAVILPPISVRDLLQNMEMKPVEL